MMKNNDLFLKSISEGLKALARGIEEVATGLENFQQQDADEKGAPEPPPETERASEGGKTAGATVSKPAAAKKKTAGKKTGGKKKGARKPSPKISSTDAVLKELKKAPEGLDPSTLAQKTGFTVRTIHNAISKLKEEGKIESVKRGVYTAA
jgi:ribosomal protein S25